MDRFWEKVDVRGPDDCWEWTGSLNNKGYSQIRIGGGLSLGHRVSYEIHNGPIPEGLHVLHSCDNPGCVNPVHLHLGTHQDNMREMVLRGRSNGGSKCDNSGEKHGGSKLGNDDIREIRRLRVDGISQRELSAVYGVAESTISQIVNRKRWRHI